MGETIAQELQCVAAKSLEELVTSPEVDYCDCRHPKLLTQRTGHSCGENKNMFSVKTYCLKLSRP